MGTTVLVALIAFAALLLMGLVITDRLGPVVAAVVFFFVVLGIAVYAVANGLEIPIIGGFRRVTGSSKAAACLFLLFYFMLVEAAAIARRRRQRILEGDGQ